MNLVSAKQVLRGRLGPACLVACACVVFSPCSARALTVYSIEAAAYADERAANSRRGELAAGMSPVFVERDAAGSDRAFRVRIGHIPYEAEAVLFHQAIVSTLPDARVVSWEWDGRTLEPTRLPLDLPFDPTALGSLPRNAECRMDYEGWIPPAAPESARPALEAGSLEELNDQQLNDRATYGPRAGRRAVYERLLAAYPSSPYASKARVAMAGFYLADKNFAGARALLDAVARGSQPSDQSQARLSLVFLTLKQDGIAAARPGFLQVANASGNEPSHRLDAMLRFAALAQGQRDYLPAWLAYTQIEKAVDTPKILALVRMKRASIAFELLADRGKGNWAEVRTLCQVAEQTPNAPPNNRATARLMYAETFYKEGHYARAVPEMEALVAAYPEQKRERAVALYWKALCLYRLGDNAGALKAYDAVNADPAKPRDLFPRFNVKELGLRDQARIYTQQGDTAKAQEALSRLLEVTDEATSAPATDSRP